MILKITDYREQHTIVVMRGNSRIAVARKTLGIWLVKGDTFCWWPRREGINPVTRSPWDPHYVQFKSKRDVKLLFAKLR